MLAVVRRHVLYLGEINSSQAGARRNAIKVFDTMSALADAGPVPGGSLRSRRDDSPVVRLWRSELRLGRPQQWGAPLVGVCCGEISDSTGSGSLFRPASRNGTWWNQLPQVLVACKLIPPGSEWRLASLRPIYGSRISASPRCPNSVAAMALLAHKYDFFSHLKERCREMFNV
jgi:hypothetical protein